MIPVFTETESFYEDHHRDFYISAYRDAPEADLNRMEAHRHTYYEVVWIERGRGTHLIDFETYTFAGPCAFVLQPGTVHRLIKDTPTQGYVLKFSLSFLGADHASTIVRYDLFADIDTRPFFPLTPEMVTVLDGLMERMTREYHTGSALSREIIASYLMVFLLEVHRFRESESRGPAVHALRYQLLRDLKRLVERHYLTEKRADFYAAALSTSRRNLNAVCRELTGRSTVALVNDRVLLEAKRRLVATSLSVRELAFQLGYSDPSYFSRFFSKHVGKSPTQFRRLKLHRDDPSAANP